MLFLVGLEVRPNLLWRLRGPIVGTGGSQVVLTTLSRRRSGIGRRDSHPTSPGHRDDFFSLFNGDSSPNIKRKGFDK